MPVFGSTENDGPGTQIWIRIHEITGVQEVAWQRQSRRSCSTVANKVQPPIIIVLASAFGHYRAQSPNAMELFTDGDRDDRDDRDVIFRILVG
jgi:hypothetical protein